MLINFNDELSVLRDIRSGKIKEGYRLGIPEIDKYIRFKPTNFNIILGHANVGKTTFILYLMLCYSLKHGKKWLILSTENDSYSLIRKLIEFLDETPINLVSEANFKTHSNFINLHFRFLDNSKMYSYKTSIETFKIIRKDFVFDGILIDPYNSLIKEPELMKGIGGHEYDYQACTEMRMYCKENKVSIWLNTHANTAALRMLYNQNHQYAGFPIPPMANDVEGGGKFVNRADDFMVVHRLVGHSLLWNETMIHVRKIKEVETGGLPTPYDEPIILKALTNNVGFSLNGKSILQIIKESFLNFL